MKFPSSVLIVAAIVPSLLIAQNDQPAPELFSLFENLDSTPNNTATSGQITPSSRGTRNTQAAPTFTLVGTSHIGNKQIALLRHLNGQVVRVPLHEGINAIPGHELYAVVNYGAGHVAIRFPTSVPCGDFPDQGVSCDSTTNISSLSLTTADAIAIATEPVHAEPSGEVIEGADAEAQSDAPRNPFTALRERNRAAVSNQATSTTRFQPRRIPPEDVPPGMRVVSTPFGDRLVEQ